MNIYTEYRASFTINYLVIQPFILVDAGYCNITKSLVPKRPPCDKSIGEFTGLRHYFSNAAKYCAINT